MRGETKSFRRNTNLSLVLRTIRDYKGISRIKIAQKLELNKSTITNIVTELLKKKVVKVKAKGSGSKYGGRKPIDLVLEERFGCILGMEIRPNICRAVVANFIGEVIFKKDIHLDFKKGSFPDSFFSCINSIRKDIGDMGIPLIGIGVGLPAIVDPYKGRIIQSYSLELNDYNFGTTIASHLATPVLLENDANCCAWGEIFQSQGKNHENFLYLLVVFESEAAGQVIGQNTIGIGIGVVIDGRVHHGSSYSAGEFKSVFWTDSLVELVNIPSTRLLQIEEEPEVLREFSKELFQNLSVVISIIDPACIFVGGDLKKHFTVVQDVVRKELSHHYVGVQKNIGRLVPADYDDYSVALGAARMFQQKLFETPTLEKRQSYVSLSWDTIFVNPG